MTDDTDQATVEAVARAISDRPVGYKRISWDCLDAEDQDVFRAYARAAIAAYERASGWRPISSAPRDGTRILLWLADEDYAVVASWRRIDDPDPRFMWWFCETDEGYTDDGSYNLRLWHPMPAPPAPDAAPQEKGDGNG